MQDTYRVLGFIAKSGMFPNFLITVLQKDLELFGLHPSGHLILLTKEGGIPSTEADWLARPTYTQDARGIVSQELAELRFFGFFKDDIIMGSRGYLKEEIGKRTMQRGISVEDLSMLKEILSTLESHRPALQLVM